MLVNRMLPAVIGLLLVTALTAPLLAVPASAQQPGEIVPVYFFWGDGCPHCERQKPYMQALAAAYPRADVQSFEVWYSEANREVLFQIAAALGFEPRAVPLTVIGDRHWIGFTESIVPEMEQALVTCLETGCPDYGPGPSRPAATATPPPPNPGPPEVEPDAGQVLTLPLLGAVDLGRHSLAFSTALIAFVDGFNLCSLWVLSILLALVINTRSRARILLVGLTFLAVTSLVYGLFIAGLFSVFSYILYLTWIRVLVALVALTFALINIKDYFWFQAGVSLTISDRHKPGIYQRMRAVLTSGRSPLGLIGATAVMALGIALVELPCTAGFPVIWTNLLAANNVGPAAFALLLALYLLIYLLDELLVFGAVVVTLNASRLQEKQGRVLKLVGGMVMLTLAVVLLIDPAILDNFSATLAVFAAAFAAAALVLLLHRRVLPRLGIQIGSEQLPQRGPRRRR